MARIAIINFSQLTAKDAGYGFSLCPRDYMGMPPEWMKKMEDTVTMYEARLKGAREKLEAQQKENVRLAIKYNVRDV